MDKKDISGHDARPGQVDESGSAEGLSSMSNLHDNTELAFLTSRESAE